jgi:hypothetical protein
MRSEGCPTGRDKAAGQSSEDVARYIRRTVLTKLAERGCSDDATAERILGDCLGRVAHQPKYDRWKHLPQMRAALEIYEQKLAALIGES